jgi:hypothetical protein
MSFSAERRTFIFAGRKRALQNFPFPIFCDMRVQLLILQQLCPKRTGLLQESSHEDGFDCQAFSASGGEDVNSSN